MGRSKSARESAVIDKIKLDRPRLYKVIMLNDDYTTMEFVVYVLQRYFNKNGEEATQIMLQIHTQGSAVCGIYSLDIAKTKCRQVLQDAKKNKYPLKVIWEAEE